MFMFGHLFEKWYKIIEHGGVLNDIKGSKVVSKRFLLDVFFDFFGKELNEVFLGEGVYRVNAVDIGEIGR
jgi:hypothetical protein